MHVVGVIAEYNPFHRGHLKQIKQIKSLFPDKTAIVLVLSSYFTQRGVPALLSPRQRAKIALEAGADLVLLLPQAFSSADAEGFARGAIQILYSSGVVPYLCFGSEINDPALHEECARFIAPESDELKALIASLLPRCGSPHRARREALLTLGARPECLSCLDFANSRLGVEYIAQLLQISDQVPLKVFITERDGLAENDLSLCGGQASASAIRQLLRSACAPEAVFRIQNWNRSLTRLLPRQIPAASLALLLKAAAEVGLPMDRSILEPAFLRIASEEGTDSLSAYRYCGAGLAERLWDCVTHCDLREELPDPAAIKSRNFTEARIRRALISLLLGIREEDWKTYGSRPAFIHPLGFTAEGKYLLRKMKSRALLPILPALSGMSSVSDPFIQKQLKWERSAGFIWHSLTGSGQMHYLDPPVYCKRK